MCVIIVKRKGVKMPDTRTVKACAKANPDGFGFATDSRTFRTTDLDELLHEIRTIKINENCILHFRLATHGSVKTENCHPFTMGQVRFAHNGILDVQPHEDMTDSETAFQDIIYPAIERHGLDSILTRHVIERVRGCSRFAIISPAGLRVFGDFTEMNGLLFSNLRFMSYFGTGYDATKIYGLRDGKIAMMG